MNKQTKVKAIGIIGLLFILACAVKVVKTYEKDPEEAVFESFLLASIAAYHGAALYTLNKQSQAETKDLKEVEPSVKTEINHQVETVSEKVSEELAPERASRAA